MFDRDRPLELRNDGVEYKIEIKLDGEEFEEIHHERWIEDMGYPD